MRRCPRLRRATRRSRCRCPMPRMKLNQYFLPDAPYASENIADPLRAAPTGSIDRDDAAQQLREGEHPDHGRDEADARSISTLPNVKRGKPARDSMPSSRSKGRSTATRCPSRGVGRDEHGAGQSQASQPEILERARTSSRSSASAGAHTIRIATPNRPPITENTRSTPRSRSSLALFRHGVASSVYAAEAGVPGMRSRARRNVAAKSPSRSP